MSRNWQKKRNSGKDLFYPKELRDKNNKLIIESMRLKSAIKNFKLLELTNTKKENIRKVSRGMKSLTSLQSVFLNFRGFVIQIKYSPNFLGCAQLSNVDLKRFSHGLKYLTHLKNFSFIFNCSEGITEIGFKHLSKAFQYLNCLKEISLDFYTCLKVPDTALDNLGQCLKYLTSLHSLSLCFNGCIEFADAALVKLGQQLEFVTFLRHVLLDLSGSEVTEVGLQSSCQSLKRLQCLRSFSFNLSRCKSITDKGVEHLNQNLKAMYPSQTISFEIMT